MDRVVELLQELATAGKSLQTAFEAEDTAAQLCLLREIKLDQPRLAAVRGISRSPKGRELWEHLSNLNVSLSDASRALSGLMSLANQQHALQAAVIHSHLLLTDGCPVFSMFDRGICGAFLKLLNDTAANKRAATGRKGKKVDADNDDFMDVDQPADQGGDEEEMEAGGPSQRSSSQCGKAGAQQGSADAAPLVAEALHNLGALLEGFGLRDQQDTVRNIAEAAAQISRSPAAAEASEACFQVLAHLLQPIHGSVREVAAMVFRLLTNNILGLGEAGSKVPSGNTAKQAAATRGRAVQFAKDCLRGAPESREAVAALARHVLLKAPDKAEFRAAAVEGAVALALALDSSERQQLVAFVARLSRTPKVSQRQMAVELAPALLEAFDDPFAPVDLPQPPTAEEGGAAAAGTSSKTPANQKLVVDGKELMAAPWGAVCLAVLVQRCADKSAVVRGRAMQHLAGVVASWTSFNGGNSREEVRFCSALSLAHEVKLQPQELLGQTPGLISPSLVSPAAADEPGGTPMTVAENTPHPRRDGPATGKSHLPRTYSCFTMPALLEGGEADLRSLLHSARKRCSDEKGQVRKAAVQLLEALLIMRAAGVQRTLPQPREVAAIEGATGDALVSVRKAGLTAAHSLLKALPDQTTVAELWVRAALPLIRDVEASIQETLLDQFQDLVTGRAVAAGAVSREGTPTSSARKAAEELRPILAAFTTGGGACKACVARACSQLKAKSRLKTKQAAAGLQQIILGLGAAPALAPEDGSELSAGGALDADAVAGAWLLFAEVSACNPGAPSWRFLQEQWDMLTQQAAGAAPEGGATSDNTNNAAQLLKVIAAAAAEFPPDQARQLSSQLLRALRGFTLAPSAAAAHVAAVAQLTERHGEGARGWVPELLSGAEKLLGAYVDSYQTGRSQAGMVEEDWRAAGALFTVGELALLRACKPSGRLVVLVQALTASRLALAPATSSQQTSQEEGLGSMAAAAACVDVPGTVQAHSWVALGKLCLTDEALAKKCVPLFVQELGRAQQPAVRNNIMVALADLVINYTALVDSHIPRLAACIRDPIPLVRTQALALLANLLQKDYVKWRGPLFHRFVLALIDDSPRVCALAEYLLGDTIATKMPNLAYNHFVEALFVLNDCQVGLHGGAAAAAAVSDAASGSYAGVADRDAFCLQGSSPTVRGKRDTIYRALLARMSPEHKFATAARLCQEVLGGVADGGLPLEECQEVLGDALRILACKEIKVTTSRGAAEDLESDPAAAVGAAKGKLVSAMMKKHLVEGVVPVIIELKRAMEAARHPLLGDLMAATAAMLKDYKNEIEDILVADKQLAKEILYDMRQAELAKQAAKAAPPPEAQAARTPASGGLARQGSLPAGTTSGTPMAAEVLLTARKASGGSGGGSGATPASGGSLPAPTPGAGRPTSKTPSSGFKTPGEAVAAAARGQGTVGRTASRLARVSGPLASPLSASDRDGSGSPAGPLSAPRLRSGRPKQAGGSRLRPREHAALVQETAALAVGDAADPPAGGGSGGAAATHGAGGEEMEGAQQVVLPFGPPPGTVGAGRERQWNVTPEAAQLDQQRQAPCSGADVQSDADAAGRAKREGAAPEPAAAVGRGLGRTRSSRMQSEGGGKGAAENTAPPVNDSAGKGGRPPSKSLQKEGVKTEVVVAGKSERRPSRKRKA